MSFHVTNTLEKKRKVLCGSAGDDRDPVFVHVKRTTGAKHNRADEKNMVGLALSQTSR